METALSAGDMQELKDLAHWLKGAGGTVGFEEFGSPSLKLENAALDSNRDDAAQQLSLLRDLSNRICMDVPTHA